MGMYTELHFNCELPKDTPPSVLAVLRYMLREQGDRDVPTLPDHPLFQTSRWAVMLGCDSYYFSADTHSTLRFDECGDSYYLCIRTNLKNYDNEIEKFVDWISPYIDGFDGDFLGFSRYEQTETPELIHLKK